MTAKAKNKFKRLSKLERFAAILAIIASLIIIGKFIFNVIIHLYPQLKNPTALM